MLFPIYGSACEPSLAPGAVGSVPTDSSRLTTAESAHPGPWPEAAPLNLHLVALGLVAIASRLSSLIRAGRGASGRPRIFEKQAGHGGASGKGAQDRDPGRVLSPGEATK